MQKINKTLLISIIYILIASNAWAATFAVNALDDSVDSSPGDGVCSTVGGSCTLRAAVMEANASSVSDTVKLLLPGTYNVSSTITITSHISILGISEGATTLNYNGPYNSFLFSISGVKKNVSIANLSVQTSGNNRFIGVSANGVNLSLSGLRFDGIGFGLLGPYIDTFFNSTNIGISGTSIEGFYGFMCGAFVAINNTRSRLNMADILFAGNHELSLVSMAQGSGTITNSVIENNVVGFLSSTPPGCTIIDGSSYTMTHVTFSGNTVYDGSLMDCDDSCRVSESAFLGNSLQSHESASMSVFHGLISASHGGLLGLANVTIHDNDTLGSLFMSLHSGASIELTNCTLSENFVQRAGSGGGSALFHALGSGTISLANNIIDGNTAYPSSFDMCTHGGISLGHNIIDTEFCGSMILHTTDIVGDAIDAGLDAFIDDGTPGGAYYPLLPDSMAINAADPAYCDSTDQMGTPRDDGMCDIGSIEFE